RTDADQIVDRFAVEYRRATGKDLTWRVLHANNPRSTIATCSFQKGHETFDRRNPHSASIWDGCDPANRNIALIAGAYLTIPMESVGEPVEDGVTDAEALLDQVILEAGCGDADKRYECLTQKVTASADAETEPPATTPAAAPPEPDRSVVSLKNDLAKAITERDAANAELVTRPTRNRWVTDMAIVGLISAILGLLGGVLVLKVGRAGAKTQASEPEDDSMEQTGTHKRPPAVSMETQKSPPRPQPDKQAATALAEKYAEEVATLTREKTDLEQQLTFAGEKSELMRQQYADLKEKTPYRERQLAVMTEERDAAERDSAEARASETSLAQSLAKAEAELETIRRSLSIAEEELDDPSSIERVTTELTQAFQENLAKRPYEGVFPVARGLYRSILEKSAAFNVLAGEVGRFNASSPDPEAATRQASLKESMYEADLDIRETARQFVEQFRKSLHVPLEEKAKLWNVLHLMLEVLHEDTPLSSRMTPPPPPEPAQDAP
ncbi:MAG: hypothetical protein V1745_02010, partial [Patescibacteria group bacterium]